MVVRPRTADVPRGAPMVRLPDMKPPELSGDKGELDISKGCRGRDDLAGLNEDRYARRNVPGAVPSADPSTDPRVARR
jgi:hypothetical protein